MAFLRPSQAADRAFKTPVVRFPLVLAAVIAVSLSARNAGAQTVADEYQVKAAYLLNFARFVEWPTDALSASSPIVIAIIGDDPFGGALDEVLRGKSANGHPIQLRHLHGNDVLTGCQIVFISTSEERRLPEILRRLGSNSVLTVSDIDRFSLRGGVVEFRMSATACDSTSTEPPPSPHSSRSVRSC